MAAEPNRPPVTAIICSRDRPELLRDCVEAVLSGDEVPDELVIVDDSDLKNEFLANLSPASSCDLRYIWRHGRGLSSATNLAISSARHEILVFTQDDAVVDPNWLAVIVEALREVGPRSIVTGQVQPGEAEVGGGFAPATIVEPGRTTYRTRPPQDVLYVQNMAIYRAAAETIGPFDERLGPGTSFPGSEDSDFALRAIDAGYAIVYEPSAIVRHRAWRDQEAFVKFRWGYGFARGGFYAKHLRPRPGYIVHRLARDIRSHLIALPRLGREDRIGALGHLALVGGILCGIAYWPIENLRTKANEQPTASTSVSPDK
jgi:GT2 family glycosyltransferase